MPRPAPPSSAPPALQLSLLCSNSSIPGASRRCCWKLWWSGASRCKSCGQSTRSARAAFQCKEHSPCQVAASGIPSRSRTASCNQAVTKLPWSPVPVTLPWSGTAPQLQGQHFPHTDAGKETSIVFNCLRQSYVPHPSQEGI